MQEIYLDTVDLPKIELEQIATIVYDGTEDDRQKAIVGAVTRMAAEQSDQPQLAVTVRVMRCACANQDCGSGMLFCEMGRPREPATWFGMFRLVAATSRHDDRPPPSLPH
ncbi:MAG: hypothetical protein IT325_09810 [Anaerolineae bacterium]|nr:hypothetical protein [Anaerolineae bacterium]